MVVNDSENGLLHLSVWFISRLDDDNLQFHDQVPLAAAKPYQGNNCKDFVHVYMPHYVMIAINFIMTPSAMFCSRLLIRPCSLHSQVSPSFNAMTVTDWEEAMRQTTV